MSYYFSIDSAIDLRYRVLLDYLPQSSAQFAYATEENLDEVIYGNAQLYLPHSSTRGVSIGRTDAGYRVGVNVGASPDDLQLALAATATLAELTESDVSPEDFEGALPVSAFRKQYGVDWVVAHQYDGLDIVRRMIEEDGDTLMLGGCLMPFHIGPYVLHQLSYHEPDEQTFAERLWMAMQRLQFIDLDRDDVRVPSRFQVGRLPGEQWTYTVIIPEQVQVLGKTDHTILVLGEEHAKLPFERVQSYAEAQNWERLDEEQYLFPYLAEADFRLLVEELDEDVVGDSISDG